MKILTVSDEECPALWDYYMPGRLQGYDLILSCGDLKSDYLSFLVTMARCPLLYVHGNHDGHYQNRPPEGCDNIDGHLVTYNGVRILGLGGCRRYRPGPHQYSDEEMRKRISRLRYQLWRAGGVDIVVTHAAPKDLGDDADPAHWGFEALRELMDKYSPKYLVHGHVHMSYGTNVPRELIYNDTKVLNAYERHSFETEEGDYKPREFCQLIYKTHPPKREHPWGDVTL